MREAATTAAPSIWLPYEALPTLTSEWVVTGEAVAPGLPPAGTASGAHESWSNCCWLGALDTCLGLGWGVQALGRL